MNQTRERMLLRGHDIPLVSHVSEAFTWRTPSGQALAVLELRLALSDFDNVAVRIADIATPLAVLIQWLCDELSSSTLP